MEDNKENESYDDSGWWASARNLVIVGLTTAVMSIGSCQNNIQKPGRTEDKEAITRDIEVMEADTGNTEEKIRVLESRYGLDIKDPEGLLKEFPKNISHLSSVLHRESMQKDFFLQSLSIPSIDDIPDHLKNSGGWASRDDAVHLKPYSVVRDSFVDDTLAHEIKHIKSFQIERRNPQFLERWEKLAVKDGEELYGEEMFRNHHAKGFVTHYASTDKWEDLAEVGEMEYSNPDRLYRLAKNHPLIKERVKREQRINLIPENFMEYSRIEEDLDREAKRDISYLEAELESKNYDVSVEKGIELLKQDGVSVEKWTDDIHKFLEESKEFLEEHPDSVYETDLRTDRANILFDKGYPEQDEIDRTIEEYKKGLKAEYKDPVMYSYILSRLLYISEIRENERKFNIYKEALDLYEKRYSSGDTSISHRGVNDFLRKHGCLD